MEQFYDFAAELADSYLVMSRGSIVQQGRGENMEQEGFADWLRSEMLYYSILILITRNEGFAVAAQLGKIALTLGTLLVSGSLFAHSHGHQMTEAEQKAANGVFEDKDVMDRTLSDWDGTRQSVYPFLLDGSLDPVFEKKAQKGKNPLPR